MNRTAEPTSADPWRPNALLSLGFFKFAFHIAVAAFGAYGYFRDEFYYLACSEHLDWGYVDHPPFSIALLAINRAILGDSLVALRFLPALAGALTVYLAGVTAREMGGGRFAQILAALATLCAPILLGMNSIYSMNSFEFLVWISSALLLIKIVKSPAPRFWILLGVVLGIGLMNKVGVLWLCSGIAVSMAVPPLRAHLKTRWPWIAAGLALLIFSPFILWNIAHDFPHAEFIRNATSGKYSSLTPIRFLADQVLLQNPLSFPLWLGGLWHFLFGRGRNHRALGIVYATALAVLLINQHSKGEYLAPAYPMLFAGGAIWAESALRHAARLWKPALAVALAVSGILLAPFAVPVLPVERYIAYARMLGVAPATAETKELSELPQFFADMHGWEELTEAVASVYATLPAEDKKDCIIYAQNYGEAASINFFGRKLGLPPAVTGHNTYHLWGPGRDSARVVIIVGGDREDHLRGFEEVEEIARSRCRYCMPYENNLPIYVARTFRRPLAELWPLTKHYE